MEVVSVAVDFAEAGGVEPELALLVCMGHMPTADTVILTAMAATTATAAAIWFVGA
jgi:hypothetical protein